MNPATVIVHWPGKDVPACEDHRQKLAKVAEAMGFLLSYTDCKPTTCTNCENEAKKSEGDHGN